MLFVLLTKNIVSSMKLLAACSHKPGRSHPWVWALVRISEQDHRHGRCCFLKGSHNILLIVKMTPINRKTTEHTRLPKSEDWKTWPVHLIQFYKYNSHMCLQMKKKRATGPKRVYPTAALVDADVSLSTPSQERIKHIYRINLYIYYFYSGSFYVQNNIFWTRRKQL